MTTMHTPGPWVTYIRNGDRYVAPGLPGTPTGRDIIARITPYFDASVNVANARLIAAAPELADALRELLAEVDTYLDYKQEDESMGERAEKARAVLAKAEGRDA